jgi:hypothetical protein
MSRVTYNLLDDVKGEAYSQLLQQSLSSCGSFILVIRHSMDVNDTAQGALNRLEPFLIQREERSEWPGTQLFDDTAQVSTFKLSHATVTMLAETAESLFSWIQPELPEDLCLFREDGRPWLVTITHEKDAYMVLSPDERAALIESIPSLQLAPNQGMESQAT